jgi:hypothetical protein
LTKAVFRVCQGRCDRCDGRWFRRRNSATQARDFVAKPTAQVRHLLPDVGGVLTDPRLDGRDLATDCCSGGRVGGYGKPLQSVQLCALFGDRALSMSVASVSCGDPLFLRTKATFRIGECGCDGCCGGGVGVGCESAKCKHFVAHVTISLC